MSYTLQEIADYVRGHIDLDESELGNDKITVWAREASTAIWLDVKRWAYFEKSWGLNAQVDQGAYSRTAIGDDVAEVVSVIGAGRRLELVGHDEAEARWLGDGTGTPICWSEWSSDFYLWPVPGEPETLSVRGYRTIEDWVAGGPGAVPDLPEPLHNTVRLWVLGQAYMQQEDPEMGLSFLDMAANEIKAYGKQLNAAPGASPLVIGGSRRRAPLGRIPYDWE